MDAVAGNGYVSRSHHEELMPQPLSVTRLAYVLMPFALLSFARVTAQGAADWPQWRGPDGDNISKEKDWSVTGKPEPLWQKNVGMGYSTVSIHDGRLATMGHDKAAQQDTIWCLDAVTGKELWKHTLPAKTWDMGHKGGTLSTPSFAGKLLFASNREGNFFCFDAPSGKLLWQKQLVDEYKLKLPTWGLATAPLILGDSVIMNVGPVLAFDLKGKLRWQTARSFGDAYSTPAVIELGKQKGLCVFDGDGVAVIAQKDGLELASAEWKTQYNVNAATPVVFGTKVFVSSGYNRGAGVFQFGGKEPKLLWDSKVMRNHMSGCCLYQDHLYGFDETALKCIDLDGNELWSEKLGKACLSMADGKLLAMTGKGELVVAAASPQGYQELSRQKVLNGGVYWTTPVLCGGLIYCRNSNGDLVCLDHRKRD